MTPTTDLLAIGLLVTLVLLVREIRARGRLVRAVEELQDRVDKMERSSVRPVPGPVRIKVVQGGRP